MSYFTYIIYSEEKDTYYIGHTDNIKNRTTSHNAGISPYTSMARDWTLVYNETFQTRSEAIKRENEIKRKKSRKYLEWLIQKSRSK